MQRPYPRFVARALIAAFALLAVVATGSLTYVLALDAGYTRMQREANDRLTLIGNAFDATVARYRYLPAVLSLADPIRDLYRAPNDGGAIAAANRYLKSLDQSAGSAELFVLNDAGMALAASNFDSATSFVGENYSFRAYFRDAMQTGEGHHYAVGATTGLPGYFLSHRIEEGGRTIGVAVVKIDLIPLEVDWARAGDPVAMVDDNGVVFLASRAEWKYRPLVHIPPARLAELSDIRQFGQTISPDPVFAPEHGKANLGRVNGAAGSDFGEYALHRRSLPEHGWTLLLFSDVTDARRHAAVLASTAALAMLAMLLIALVAWQRGQVVRAKLEAHEALEARVAERTAELRRTQESLTQSAKLASLGQALAGVAHEINQPLAALTTYVASSRVMLQRNEVDRAAGNLDLISAIAERMMTLVSHLRMFARKETGARSAADLAGAVDNAIRLLQYRIRNENIELTRTAPPEPVFTFANPVRLEQVMVNLLSNAIDAMRESERKRLAVAIGREGDRAVVEIADSGHGIAPEHIKSLFDPFFTTKEIGEGLGLGLSISYGIIRESGGDILVESAVGRGTCFKVVLPAMQGAEARQRSELPA